ncbi:C-terminal [Bartonella apis]|uniref:shikimate dehydrogenase n=1 Tax=Bartonella apis TaxID=1686310 RepID=UPI0039976CBE
MKNITTEIPHAFVTGYPVGHSLSPQIHRFWLKKYKLAGTYDAVEVKPENFEAFINSLQKKSFCGGNVTLPHKEEAFRLAEKKDQAATRIGAANTLWFENDTLCASNTDGYGFEANLDDFAPGWGGGVALVIGAGGAARAVIYTLEQRGFDCIYLVNRTKSRADKLAGYFGKPVKVRNWSEIDDLVPEVDFIVNTTSLGMKNNLIVKESKPFIHLDRAKPSVLVTDIVYTPLMTPILLQAKANNLKYVDGIGMLLHQAVPGFERWFGIRPVVDNELRQEILGKMGY